MAEIDKEQIVRVLVSDLMVSLVEAATRHQDTTDYDAVLYRASRWLRDQAEARKEPENRHSSGLGR
jgi:hypothetical protein